MAAGNGQVARVGGLTVCVCARACVRACRARVIGADTICGGRAARLRQHRARGHVPSGRANGLPARVCPLDVALGGLPAQVGDSRGGHAFWPAEALRALGAPRAGELRGAAALAWLGLGSGLGLRLGQGLGLRLGSRLGSGSGLGLGSGLG